MRYELVGIEDFCARLHQNLIALPVLWPPQVRECCLEVIGAAPDYLEHYRREVRELQVLVSDFRREMTEMRASKTTSDASLTLHEQTYEHFSSQHPTEGLLQQHYISAPLTPKHTQLFQGSPFTTPHCNDAPQESVLFSTLGGARAHPAVHLSLRRVYIELESAPIQSW